MKNVRVFSVISIFILTAGLAVVVYVNRADGKSQQVLPPASTTNEQRSDPSTGKPALLAIADVSPDEFGAMVAASADTRGIDLARDVQSALLAESAAMLTAYASTDPQAVLKLWSETGVTPPATWSDPAWAQARWETATASLRGVTFDLSKTSVRRVQLGVEPPSPSEEARQRACGRRDVARPFLDSILQQGGDALNRVPAYELVMTGTVPTPPEEISAGEATGPSTLVSVGFTFMKNPDTGRWILVRTCLYNFPRTTNAAAPVL